MKRPFVIVAHAGYWMLYLALVSTMVVLISVPAGSVPRVSRLASAFPVLALAIVPNILAFYAAYGLISSRFLARRRIAATVSASLASCLAAAAAGLLLALWFFGPRQPAFAEPRETLALVVLLGVIAGIHTSIGLVVRGFVDWYGDLAVKDALRRRTHEMEVSLVRAKLEPHFLFNTLNNIDVLIARDPSRASVYLNKLSEILRFVLYDTRREQIALADELGYIEKYIALEAIRKRTPRHAVHEVVGDPTGLAIAPMTFIPFIENAFKHADGCSEEGTIVSRVTVDHGRVLFECTNRYVPAAPPRDAAHGLGDELVRQRLQLLYPGRHALHTRAAGDAYHVHLTIEARC